MNPAENGADSTYASCTFCGGDQLSCRVVFADAKRRSGARSFAWFCRMCGAVWTEPVDGDPDDEAPSDRSM